MPQMTDVMPALLSYQEELSAGRLLPPPSRAHTDPDLRLFTDFANDELRISYTRVDEDGIVTAFVSIARAQPLDGLACVGVGYAVPERFRGQGRATEILTAAIKEVTHGFTESGIHAFAIEAVISADNPASIAVARKVLTDNPREITDDISGQPALQFVRKVTL